MLKVGFAGLGRMGAPMARNLHAAGMDLAVWNRGKGPVRAFIDDGVPAPETPAELARDRDVIVTMLAGPSAVDAVVRGPAGLLRTARPGTVVVEMSTIGPEAARSLASAAAERDVTLLDAPVSGSIPAATSAELACFVGGPLEALERARPVLTAMARSVVHVGPSGAGAAVKLGLNAVLGLLNQAIAETLILAEADGVPRETMYAALEDSAVAAPYLGYKREAFLNGGTQQVAFPISGLRKDLELVLSRGRERGVPLFGAATVAQMLTSAAGLGLGDADMADVTIALQRLTPSSAA
jgi:3-hydroxyisobutyrate dehydrogenase-like beta-hydroxyacid dehydrogenase